jgi:heme o synthase
MHLIKQFYAATKPRLVRGNLLLVLAGYVFGLGDSSFDTLEFFYLLTGSWLIMSAACVVNNIIDTDVDKIMSRTQRRPTAAASKQLLQYYALFAVILLSISIWLLSQVGARAVWLGIIGFVGYGIIYTYLKRVTVYNTWIGGVFGAIPPVVGYVAASGAFDRYALLLFTVVFFWQIPHFYALAIDKKDEYKKAGIRMLPSYASERRVRAEMFVALIAYATAIAALAWQSNSWVIAVLNSIAVVYWAGVFFNKNRTARSWNRRIFRISIAALSLFSLSLLLDYFVA